jgi:hypothetical protein
VPHVGGEGVGRQPQRERGRFPGARLGAGAGDVDPHGHAARRIGPGQRGAVVGELQRAPVEVGQQRGPGVAVVAIGYDDGDREPRRHGVPGGGAARGVDALQVPHPGYGESARVEGGEQHP